MLSSHLCLGLSSGLFPSGFPASGTSVHVITAGFPYLKPASTGNFTAPRRFCDISWTTWGKSDSLKFPADEASFMIKLPWHLPCSDRIKGTQLYVPTALILGEVKTGVKISTECSTFEFVQFTDYGAGKPT
jgi:hypothetical protein